MGFMRFMRFIRYCNIVNPYMDVISVTHRGVRLGWLWIIVEDQRALVNGNRSLMIPS